MPTTEHHDVLLAELRRSALIPPGERVLVALSGGHDSTALLLALREDGHDVVAAHYDHALQAGSAVVADRVERLCVSLGLDVVVERRSEPMSRGSVQAAARALRYAFLERAAARAGATTIALAHTADDLVEGVALHMLRGCGIAGMRGMPSSRGPFVRPLLNVWRSDVLAFLESRGVAAIEDPANSDQAYARVRVRRDLLPALERDRPGIKRRLHQAARRAAVLHDAIAAEAGEAAADGSMTLVAVAALSEPVAAEALRILYTKAAGVDPALGRSHIEAMLRLVKGGRGGRGVDLPGGYRFRVVDSRMQVVPRVSRSIEAALEMKACPGCSSPGAAHLKPGLDLKVGYRRPGLRMRPVGGLGTRKLQDLFVDAHVPREDRDTWPLVFAGDKLAWVPGVAVDRDLQSDPGKASLHVTITRILFDRTPKKPVLESADSPRGEPS
jgi:tRNA(Ile)-lysidine synthase